MMTGASAQSSDTIVYRVEGGDTLSTIIKRYYGNIPPDRQQAIINRIQANNPDIKNPDRIYPDQLIRLEVPAQHCPATSGFSYRFGAHDTDQEWFSSFQRNWPSASPEERSIFPLLSQILLGSGSANLTMIDRTFKANRPLLAELAENYESYKHGNITKGQYNYRRTKLISQFSSRLGPTNFLLNGTADPREVLRISREKGTLPTQAITQQINKMNRLSKVASRGGIVLSAVGLGIACHEIAHAETGPRPDTAV